MADSEEFKERVEREMAGFDVGAFFDTSETPLTGIARAYDEVHKTIRENSDFSDAQALYMTAVMFTGNPGQPPQN